MLKELTKDIAFFQQYQENDYVHDSCCSYMNYESYEKDQAVFEIRINDAFETMKQILTNILKIDQIGDKFYIILEGTVGVYIYNESREMICVKQLGKGFSFGELALLYESPRMATIICLEKCHFAVLNKKEFLRVLKNFQKENLNKKLLYLQNLPLFQKINQPLLRQIYSKAFDIRTTKGQVIFKQGSPAENFYIVKQGEFQVKQDIPHMANQEELHSIQSLQNQDLTKITNKKQKYLTVQISLLIQGDYFGEEDLLKNNDKRSFSVQCATANGEIIMIQKNLFQQILEEHHSNNFLREHLAIKEGQHKVRIQNAKKQISKFKQFLTEDREQLKVTKQIQEEQISFQKNNRIIKSQKEININFDKNLMDQNQPDISKQSRQQRREKKSITHFIVNEEQQQIINDKIQKLVEQKVNSNGRKPKVPTQKDMHNQRQDYSNQNIKNPNQSEQFPSQKSINEQSSQSISNQTLTPYDSPLNITPTEKRKSQLIKILAQKMPYKQSLFSENLIFADRNDSCISIQHIDEVQNNKSPEPQTDDRYQSFNRGSMLKKKSHQIKNINDQKIQFASKPIELNQLNLENRRGNYIQNERTQINTETSSQFGLSSLPESPVKYGVPYRMQSQQALFYMNQQQQENISSFNNPDRINPHQQIKSMFEDKSKFVSTFFNKSQIKKLTSSLQKYKESSLNEERMNIKRSILQKKTKNNNYIDYSSDDLKRNLIDQVNILTSPRQQQTSIILGSSCERYKLPKQASQPTLKFIEFSKLEVPEMNTKNKNITMTDFYKKSKQNIDLNNNSQNQMFSLNNINKVQQLRSSINLRLEEESSKLIPLTSSRNNNNQTQKQQLNLQSSLKNLFQNNIHIRKDQNEQNKQQPLKMSIRFQNLFKNHQQQNQ